VDQHLLRDGTRRRCRRRARRLERADLRADPSANKTDGPGLVLSTAAMALLIYTIIEAPGHGWSSARTLGGFALAAAVFGAFIARERTPQSNGRPQPVPQPGASPPPAAR